MNPEEKARIEKQRTFESDLLRAQEEALEQSIEDDRAKKEELKKEGDKIQRQLKIEAGIKEDELDEVEIEAEEIEMQNQLAEDGEFYEEEIEEDGGDDESSDVGKPAFPTTFMGLSIAKDFVDTTITLTGIGAFLPPIYGPFYDIAFFMWRRKRISNVKINEVKKVDLKDKTFGKMIATFVGEEIPIVDLAPLSTFNVYTQYKAELAAWEEAQDGKRSKPKPKNKVR